MKERAREDQLRCGIRFALASQGVFSRYKPGRRQDDCVGDPWSGDIGKVIAPGRTTGCEKQLSTGVEEAKALGAIDRQPLGRNQRTEDRSRAEADRQCRSDRRNDESSRINLSKE